MVTSQRQTSQGTQGVLEFSREGSPASLTAAQESGSERKMTATSGQKCLEQLGKLPRVGSWAKTFAALLVGTEGWFSTKCRLIWRLRGTRSSRLYFQLVPSVLPTAGTGSGLLHTPRKIHATMSHEMADTGHKRYRVADLMNTSLLPTPTKVQRDHPERVEALKASGAKTNSILDAVNFYGMLPTPTASSDAKGGCTRASAKRQNDALAHAVHGQIGEPGKTSQLNPLFVEEMMGFPENWTLSPFLSGGSSQSGPTETQ